MNNKYKKRVIGIDVGTAIVGWAVVEKFGQELKLIDAKAILTSSKEIMPNRLLKIQDELAKIIKEYQPSEMAVEDLFFFKNQKTVMKVSQARGVIIVTGAAAGLPVFDYTPLQIKQAVTSYGRADKDQVKVMVGKILKIKQMPTLDDINDAMAVAVCHINSVR